jgi:outer membrane putative beta-barrel porin/alpha-amylase
VHGQATILTLTVAAALGFASPASAGPPYVTDDPQPTDYEHFEIYAFTSGMDGRDGVVSTTGIDFNYGGAPDLQLTAVLPLTLDNPRAGPETIGIGNIELAAKYKFLHQEDFGIDVAVFPRLFLPAVSTNAGEGHFSLLLPVFIGKTFEKVTTFGGAGCTINQGGDSRSFCQMGGAVTYQVTPKLNLGFEIHHEGADTIGGAATTGLGIGAVYDINENFHLMASGGRGIQNAADTNRQSWYLALLSTF